MSSAQVLVEDFTALQKAMALRIRVLSGDMERDVWSLAEQVYSDKLTDVLTAALRAFRRSPGHDSVTRIYAQAVGDGGLHALRQALIDNPRVWALPVHGGIELRWRLRLHLTHYLRGCLMKDGLATDQMRDEHFSTDLGL